MCRKRNTDWPIGNKPHNSPLLHPSKLDLSNLAAVVIAPGGVETEFELS